MAAPLPPTPILCITPESVRHVSDQGRIQEFERDGKRVFSGSPLGARLLSGFRFGVECVSSGADVVVSLRFPMRQSLHVIAQRSAQVSRGAAHGKRRALYDLSRHAPDTLKVARFVVRYR